MDKHCQAGPAIDFAWWNFSTGVSFASVPVGMLNGLLETQFTMLCFLSALFLDHASHVLLMYGLKVVTPSRLRYQSTQHSHTYKYLFCYGVAALLPRRMNPN